MECHVVVKVLEIVAGDLADAALESIERDARRGIVRGRLEGCAEAVLAATALPVPRAPEHGNHQVRSLAHGRGEEDWF